jgi:hypothetical protein
MSERRRSSGHEPSKKKPELAATTNLNTGPKEEQIKKLREEYMFDPASVANAVTDVHDKVVISDEHDFADGENTIENNERLAGFTPEGFLKPTTDMTPLERTPEQIAEDEVPRTIETPLDGIELLGGEYELEVNTMIETKQEDGTSRFDLVTGTYAMPDQVDETGKEVPGKRYIQTMTLGKQERQNIELSHLEDLLRSYHDAGKLTIELPH